MIDLSIHAADAAELRHKLAGILAESAPVTPAPTIALPAQFGAPLQGGFYAGPHWEDGKLVHLIGANESLGDHKWNDAKTAAQEYRGDDFDDWFLPSRDHLEIARIYAQNKFEKVWCWTSTPYGPYSAWAVDFEYGLMNVDHRRYEFRVRPFRRLSL